MLCAVYKCCICTSPNDFGNRYRCRRTNTPRNHRIGKGHDDRYDLGHKRKLFDRSFRQCKVYRIFFHRLYVTGNQSTGGSQINVKMVPDANQLSEVVVTAFGIEREKKALGYSVQVVDGAKLTEARESNVANSLKGKVAGLHVNPSSGGAGGSSYVMIRGNSSLAGNGQPLYVVDGVPIDNQTLDGARVDSGRDYGDGINNINPMILKMYRY
jgi:hypothetical protein